jgi:hypothetical protein
VDCDEAALDEFPTFLEAVLAAKKQRSPEFVELPAQTGRVRFTDSNMGRWRFPMTEKSEIDRLVEKLTQRWAKKFDDAREPTCLVVRTKLLYAADPRSILARAITIVRRLRPLPRPYAKLGGVLIYDEFGAGLSGSGFRASDGVRLHVGMVDGGARASLLVANPHAALPFQEIEAGALVGPEMFR